jgi:hypothetical protein
MKGKERKGNEIQNSGPPNHSFSQQYFFFCSGKVWHCELNSLKAKRGSTPKRGMKGVKFHTRGIKFHSPVVTFHTRRGIEFHSQVVIFHTRMRLHMVKKRASIQIHTSSGNSFCVCH